MICPRCQTAIKDHPAAACLDALAAERIFGWLWVQPPRHDYGGALPEQGQVLASPEMAAAVESGEYKWPPRGVIPYDFFLSDRRHHFSRDDGAAHKIIDRMTYATVEYWEVHFRSTGVEATFFYDGGRDRPWKPGEYVAWAEEFALAVTRAALLATDDFTSELPAEEGWYDVIFNPGEQPSRVYVHPGGGHPTWRYYPEDDPESVAVPADDVSLIRYRRAEGPPK